MHSFYKQFGYFLISGSSRKFFQNGGSLKMFLSVIGFMRDCGIGNHEMEIICVDLLVATVLVLEDFCNHKPQNVLQKFLKIFSSTNNFFSVVEDECPHW